MSVVKTRSIGRRTARTSDPTHGHGPEEKPDQETREGLEDLDLLTAVLLAA